MEQLGGLFGPLRYWNTEAASDLHRPRPLPVWDPVEYDTCIGIYCGNSTTTGNYLQTSVYQNACQIAMLCP